MSQNGITIKHIKVSPYHPASNGQAVRVFKEGITKMERGSLKTKLARFLLKYRITPHSTTGVSPAELLMNRQLHTQLDLLRPKVSNRVLEKKTQQKSAHDYHAKYREIQVDDPVYVKDSRRPKSWIAGTIVEKTGEVIRRHQDHLRIRTDPDPTPQVDNENQDIVPMETPLVSSDTPQAPQPCTTVTCTTFTCTTTIIYPESSETISGVQFTKETFYTNSSDLYV